MFDETLMDVARRVVEANREGPQATREMFKTLYAADVVSVEAVAMESDGGDASGAGREARGHEAILGKHDWFDNAFEVHASSSSDPFFHGEDRFAVIYELDATTKATGTREPMKEVGIYTVQDGKVVR
ncbi:MAG: nuclear transport factor 2 family protein, partial [Pseudomonadota bacterium]